MATHNERSSHTANALALRRISTNIPFSQDIVDALEYVGLLTKAERELGASRSGMTPFFEARYLMTDRIIRKEDVRQVVELAAGLSPRGIDMTTDPEVTYIEVDLQREITLKQTVMAHLINRRVIRARPNLRFVCGSVTDPAIFGLIEDQLRSEPVAVVCEGLLRYLSFPDKEILGVCIRDVLQVFGGVWITPDIEFTSSDFVSADQLARYEQMAATGMDVRSNLFRDMTHAITFFGDCGFSIRCFPLIDLADKLVSPARLGLSAEQVADALRNRVTFVLTVD